MAGFGSVLFSTLLLAGCGSGNSASGSTSVRLVNATLTHASLNLVADGSIAIPATATDSASTYATLNAGSPALQVDDAASSAILSTLAPSLSNDAHYTLLAYEVGGLVRTSLFADSTSQPSTGTSLLRVFDAATEAGAIDVYISAAATSPTTPTLTLAAATAVQTTTALSLLPGAYHVRITGAGNSGDVRLDIPSVTLADQQVATLLLTPTIGGTLVNGAVAVEQGSYFAARNQNARVRLAAAVSAGAVVAASAGSTVIEAGAASPSVGAYALVTAASPLAITVNGSSVGAPSTTITAGSDVTLLVYGTPGAAVANAVVDDNRLPVLASNVKLRLVNGITGAATPLTLTADFAVVAANVAPDTASTYALQPASTNMRLEVMASTSQTPLYAESALNLPGGAVYTLFMLGDAGATQHLLRKDR